MYLTFHNSYVILESVPSTVIFWTELSCWHKNYSNKTTLHLDWSHRYKNSTVVNTIWLTATKYSYLKWQCSLCRCFLSSFTTKTFIGRNCIIYAIWVARWKSYKKQELLTLREFTLSFLWGTCCSSSYICCVFMLSVPCCDVRYDFRKKYVRFVFTSSCL